MTDYAFMSTRGFMSSGGSLGGLCPAERDECHPTSLPGISSRRSRTSRETSCAPPGSRIRPVESVSWVGLLRPWQRNATQLASSEAGGPPPHPRRAIRSGARNPLRLDVRRDRFEDLRPDVDLDHRGDDQDRDREHDGDEGRRQQLVPLAAAAGDQPGGQRQEERGQLEQRVREDAEDQRESRDVELGGEGRALEAEDRGLGAEREEGDRADEEDRQLARLDVDPAREAGRAGRRRSASRRRR